MEIKQEIITGVSSLRLAMYIFFALCHCLFCLLRTAAHRAIDKDKNGHKIVLSCFYYTKLQKEMKSFCMVQSCLLLVECMFFSSFNDSIALSGCPQGR